MLSARHDYVDTPVAHEAEMTLRCKWCNRTPSKARQDGCAMHELNNAGELVLSEYNPDGKIRFAGRLCLECNGPIMGHYLRKGSDSYWCSLMGQGDETSSGLVAVPVDQNEYWPDAAKYK